jgi:ABC-2 type transport system permease protein
MRNILNLVWAFIRKDAIIAASYRLQFLFSLVSGFFSVLIFFFVAKLIDPTAVDSISKEFHTDYFSFALVGVATTGLLDTAVVGFGERLRIAMTEGSLEMMFAAPMRPAWIVIMPSVWSYFFESVRALILIVFGVLLCGAQLHVGSISAVIIVVLSTITAYTVFGLLSVAVIIVAKRGDPVSWAFANASALVAGAYFPTDLLPPWIAWCTDILPMTYAYHGLRVALLAEGTLSEVMPDVWVLSSISSVGLPIAFFLFNLAVAKARVDGSLGAF